MGYRDARQAAVDVYTHRRKLSQPFRWVGRKIKGAYTFCFHRYTARDVTEKVRQIAVEAKDIAEEVKLAQSSQQSETYRLKYQLMLLSENFGELTWGILGIGGFVCGVGERPYSELFVCGPSKSGNRVIAGLVPEGFEPGSTFDVWLPDGTFTFSEHGYGPHKMTVGQEFHRSPSGKVSFTPEESFLLQDMVTIADRFGWGRWTDPYKA